MRSTPGHVAREHWCPIGLTDLMVSRPHCKVASVFHLETKRMVGNFSDSERRHAGLRRI